MLVFAWCLFGYAADDSQLVANTNTGQIRGVSRSGGGAEFLGIPFAQPPVGKLRWHEPVEVQPWTGIRDAVSFGSPCAQPVLGDWNRHDAEAGKEDCLYLNVITPVWPPKGPLPVMLWLHGGANAGGTASSPLYKDGTLANHGIVLVTTNYRLGIFGFFAHPELTRESPHHASGNYGLMDQIAALRFVRANIARFGGDPNNITVFGQSAGAQDMGMLMVSPLSKDLFQKAIGESGSPLAASGDPLARAEQVGRSIAESLKAPNENSLEFLRGLSVDQLLQAMQAQNSSQSLGPVIDGYVLERAPAQVFAAREEAGVPLLIGTTSREFAMSGTPDELRAAISQVAGSLAEKAYQLYGLANGGSGATDPLYGTAGNQWLADLAFRCPAATEADWHNSPQHAAYVYQFERAIPGQEDQGSVHSADLPYVFGYYPKTGNIAGKFSDIDFKIADLVETYFTNFAKTGSPNGRGVPDWPSVGNSQNLIRITEDGQVLRVSGGLRRPQCDLHREILKRYLRAHASN